MKITSSIVFYYEKKKLKEQLILYLQAKINIDQHTHKRK